MVVDTMVFAYALLGVEEFREKAIGVLEKAKSVAVPDTIRAELANVLWQWVRHRGVDPAHAFSAMEDAESLYSKVLSSEALWQHALALAIEHDHTVYDTLFVSAAEQERTRVVTFDVRFQQAFPSQVLSAESYIHASGK
jgi:predicted nucleic acid-binding protein